MIAAILWTIFALVSAFIFLLIIEIIIFLKAARFSTRKEPSPGIVLLHQIPPNERVPNISPPCLKLETFLRMTKIPYEVEYGMKFSKKGKVPWIEYNGREIADSNFIVRFLQSEFHVDLNQHLSEAERAVCHAMITMLEENTYWVQSFYCTIDNNGAAAMRDSPILSKMLFPLNAVVYMWLAHTQRGYLWAHGIGRHTRDEIYQLGRRDLQAISTLLGDKTFVMGDKPCLLDAVMFGLLANITWTVPESPLGRYIRAELPNIIQHCTSIKEIFYPDWDEILTGQSKAA